jgi:hypothetical protein
MWSLGTLFTIFESGMAVVPASGRENPMKILVLEKPSSHASAGACEPFLREEAARVWSLCKEGVIREIYFRADRREAVLLMETADADDARKILSTLPLARENLIAFDVIPLVPYAGFERLFASPGAS